MIINHRSINRARTCHEIGVCQRTEPTCHHACRLVSRVSSPEPVGSSCKAPTTRRNIVLGLFALIVLVFGMGCFYKLALEPAMVLSESQHPRAAVAVAQA